MQAQYEDRASYDVHFVQTDDEIIARAKEILSARLHRDSNVYFDAPQVVRDWLVVNYASIEHEEFGVIFLDARHRIIQAGTLFRGTLTQTSVYPREVVKAALQCNAAAAVIYHNHPSGIGEPSSADEVLTKALKNALDLIDVRLLDHFVVAGTSEPLSFAERGLI